MKFLNIIFIVFFPFCSGLFGQDIDLFKQKLNDLNDFREIQKVIEDEYKQLPEEIRNKGGEGYLKEKHMKRWEWWMSSHLGPDGELVNINKRTMKAVKESLDTYPASDVRSTNSSWSLVGPTESSYQNSESYCVGNGMGRVDKIAFHPTDPDILYIGTPGGGIWKTTDGGGSWTGLTNYISSLGISGIKVSHADPTTIYALSGNGNSTINSFIGQFGYIRQSVGVFKSTDNGDTWQLTGQLADDEYVGFELEMDPNDADVLYAATSVGLYKTSNGGESWSMISDNGDDEIVYDVAIKPGSSDVIYYVTEDEFFKSEDGGTSWVEATIFGGGSFSTARKSIAVTEDNNSIVYILNGNNALPAGQFGGLYRSLDSGSLFSLMSNTPNVFGQQDDGSDDGNQSNFNNCIAASHTDHTDIVVGGLTCFRSGASGNTNTWFNSTSYFETGSDPYIHPDVHDLQFNPLDGHLYATSDGGVYVSEDEGVTWTDITANISTTMVYHLDQFSGSIKMVIGNQDNGIKHRQNLGGDFEHVNSGDGFYSSYHPTNNGRFWATLNTNLFRYRNNGSVRTGNRSPNSNWYNTVQMHNTDESLLICGSVDIFKSTDYANTWTNAGASGSWAITSCPSNNSKFYATGAVTFASNSNGSAYLSTDTGDTWSDLSGNPGFPSTFTKLTDINVEPDNSSKVWMTCGGYEDGSKVYYSIDSGSNWTNMTGSLPNIPVHCVAITEDGDVYIGTDIGVFYRNSSMTDWIPFSNNLPNVPVTDMRIDPDLGFNGRIYIATFGRGVWWDDLAINECIDLVAVDNTIDGYEFYQADENISSTARIKGNSGVQTFFKAGESVTLTPGFIAEEHAEFKAYIGPCGTGDIPTTLQEDDDLNSRRNDWDNIDTSIPPNHSRFNIEKDEIECYIMSDDSYQLRVVDENFRHMTDLVEKKFTKGTHVLNLETQKYKKQNELVYVELLLDGKRLYLQEL